MEALRRQRRGHLLQVLLLNDHLQRALRAERDARNRNRRQRRFWVRQILQLRQAQGDYANLIQEMRIQDHETFFNYMRMTPEVFDNLLHLVGPIIARGTTNYRETIHAESRLSMTIRYLATGDSMASVALSYRIGRSTLVGIIPTVCEAVWNALKDRMLQPSSEQWLRVSQEFEERWNFPHCIGALDEKHVVMKAPPNSGSSFYNYKGQHSMVLMALASASYRFLMVDIGAQGRHSDSGVFRNSVMGQMFYDNEMDLPNPAPLSNDHPEEMPYVMVADEAFQLNAFTLRPFPGRGLTPEQIIYNYRLSRTRRVIENSYGIMVSRWEIYLQPMKTSLTTTEQIVKATVCLHNFLMPESNYCAAGYADYVDDNGQIVEGRWRNRAENINGFADIGAAGSNAHSRYASHVRSYFMDYFMEEGAVPWQQDLA